MVDCHYDSRPIGTQVRCIDTQRGAALLMFGELGDVCVAEGCDTILRGSNPHTVCALHEGKLRATLQHVPFRERRKKETTDVGSRRTPPRPAVHPDHGEDEMTTKEQILQMLKEANGAAVKRPPEMPKGTWDSSIHSLRKKGHKILVARGGDAHLEISGDNGGDTAAPQLPIDEAPSAEVSAASKVRARSLAEWAARAACVLSKTAWPQLYVCLADLMATENATEQVRLSRVVNGLYDPLWALEMEIGAGAMEKGLRAAIKAGAPNATYVEKAAHGYRESKPEPKPVEVRAGTSEWEIKDGQSHVVMTLAEFEALTQRQTTMTVEEFERSHGDPEVNAIAAIFEALAELNDTARRRVLEYAAVRYVSDAAA